MSRLIGPRAFPDGSASNTDRTPPRKSPSDLRREARRLNDRTAKARDDRRDGWPDGKDEFAVDRQERTLSKLAGEKRGLRRDVYTRAPELEGANFHKHHPGRSA